MKFINTSYLGEVTKKVVMSAVIKTGLNEDSTPLFLNNDKETAYHWIDVGLLNDQGQEVQQGSCIVWNKRFEQNPARFQDGKTLQVEIALSGDGAGVGQEHLGDGRFDLAALGINMAELKDQMIERQAVL